VPGKRETRGGLPCRRRKLTPNKKEEYLKGIGELSFELRTTNTRLFTGKREGGGGKGVGGNIKLYRGGGGGGNQQQRHAGDFANKEK